MEFFPTSLSSRFFSVAKMLEAGATNVEVLGSRVAYDVMRSRGVPAESDAPYNPGSIGACHEPEPGHIQYGVDGTRFLDVQSSTGQPSVEDIKAAIVDTGAATIVVAVTGKFDGYTTGSLPIQNTDMDLTSNRGLHEMVVVGWDDELGAWHIKNSWGTGGWGEAGLGWIVYDDKSILGTHFSTATPRNVWSPPDQVRIMNSIVGELLATTPNIFSLNPLVNWPMSLGFPAEKLSVSDGMSFATRAGLLQPGTPAPAR